MRTTDQLRTGQNATADDCARLWRTLTHEYISDLEIKFVFLEQGGDPFGLRLELVSVGLDPRDGTECVNVWSSKSFFNPLHLISWGGLFDLLISGYRQIDDYFRYGEVSAPARRLA